MAVFFGFPPFLRYHGGLQWHHLCLQPDWQWEVIHHAGSCRSFLTERDHSQRIWTHLWEHTGRCERDCVDKFLLKKTLISYPKKWVLIAWSVNEWGQIWGALFLILKLRPVHSQVNCTLIPDDVVDLRCGRTKSPLQWMCWVVPPGMNCQGRLDLLKGGGHPAVGGAPQAACTVQPHPKSCVLCSVLKMPSSCWEPLIWRSTTRTYETFWELTPSRSWRWGRLNGSSLRALICSDGCYHDLQKCNNGLCQKHMKLHEEYGG